MPDTSSKTKGTLILSTARSGSSWLGSLANATGKMGVSLEWLGIQQQPLPPTDLDADGFFNYVVQSASSPNGRFSVKIFPRHLRESTHAYGFDFIKRCVDTYDTRLVLLIRKNRLEQAISLVRARQSHQWKLFSDSSKNSKPSALVYDFDALCLASFHIGRAYEFWQTYLTLTGLPHDVYYYETLCKNPTPWLASMAEHLGVQKPKTNPSELLIQRDDITLEWQERFAQDIASRGIPESVYQPAAPDRSLSNAIRVFKGLPATFDTEDLRF